jgi:hypothetical protein
MKYVLLILLVYGMQAIRVANDFPKMNNNKEFDFRPPQFNPDWLSAKNCSTRIDAINLFEEEDSNSEKCNIAASYKS